MKVLPNRVIRRFLGNRDIVNVRFRHASRGHAHKLRLGAHRAHRGAARITHRRAHPTHQLMNESEAKDLVEKKISLPAYDQCLKASHVFNILDARGAISVAQRAGYISRIRDITKSAAGVWLDSQK